MACQVNGKIIARRQYLQIAKDMREILVRGAVWGELVCGKTFPDSCDFSGNIAILGGRIGSVAVRQWRFPCLGHANSLNKKQGINFAVTGKL
jgi:hypothetical protein